MAKLDVYNAATRMHSDSKPSASNRRVGITHISNSIYQKLLFIEPRLRRSIPFAIIISLIALATIRFASLYDWRHTIDKNARSTLSLLSSSIVNKIDHDLLAFTQQKKVASLSPNHLQNILITLHHHS
ncbi:MAG: PAS domain-containing sensor histidine kinase, partial [Bartonella sp.]|nr:PAS domain-containing sensor histidine kinase [Bartonella sp.]